MVLGGDERAPYNLSVERLFKQHPCHNLDLRIGSSGILSVLDRLCCFCCIITMLNLEALYARAHWPCRRHSFGEDRAAPLAWMGHMGVHMCSSRTHRECNFLRREFF